MMKKSLFVLLGILVLSSLLLAACGGGSDGDSTTVTRPEVPAEYANLTNPLAGDTNAIQAGENLYDANCASCHGDTGLGDGIAGESLDPKPANLVNTVKETTEGYQHYRILKGGMMDPVNSSMPAQEGLMSDEQIWQIVAYMNTWK